MGPGRSSRAALRHRKVADGQRARKNHMVYHQPLVGAVNPFGLAGNSLKHQSGTAFARVSSLTSAAGLLTSQVL